MARKKVLDGRKEAIRAIKVKLDIEHNPKLKAQLDKAMKMVSKFFNFAPTMFSSFLYNFDNYVEWAQEHGKMKLPEGFDTNVLKDVYDHLPKDPLSYLAKDIANNIAKKELLYIRRDNCRIVKVGHGWFLETKLDRATKRGEKLRIPINLAYNDYYGALMNAKNLVGYIYKEGDTYFLVVVWKEPIRYGDNKPTVFIGIDLNFYKHVATLYNPETMKWEWNYFFDLSTLRKQLLRRIKLASWHRSKATKLKNEARETGNRALLEESERHAKLAREHYGARVEMIKKSWGDFLNVILKKADGYWEKGYNVVLVIEDPTTLAKIKVGDERHKDPNFSRWVKTEWMFGWFEKMLASRPYPYLKINPAGTSKYCHRCGSELEIYGNHGRLVACPTCGLKDFNRDLNAARNIALRGYKYWAKVKGVEIILPRIEITRWDKEFSSTSPLLDTLTLIHKEKRSLKH